MSGKNQGEGNKEAARRFNEDEREFVRNEYDAEEAAEKAKPDSAEEAAELERARRETANRDAT